MSDGTPESDLSVEERGGTVDSASELDLSVLVPSFNSGGYIAAAIESALAQDGFDFEVLVQDGGSADGTLDVLHRFSDGRLDVVSEPDAGQADALNRALGRARGEYILWLNADDLLHPHSARSLLEKARTCDHDVVHGDFDIIGETGELIKPYESAPLSRDRLFRHGAYIFSGSLLVKRSLLESIGGFNAELHFCMDYELYLRLEHAARSPGYVNVTVGQFRRQPASKTETSWKPFAKEQFTIARRFGSSRLTALRTYAWYSTYNRLRSVFRSRLWLRIRSKKKLGGS